MVKDKTIAAKAYESPVSCALEIDYELCIAQSSDLRDMDVKTIYDEGF
ncbi:MAG: hypothetical protein J5640_03690 [Bacteroidales bacterium]|nr:hypothetical protein [Bacteroidales bacterium]